MGRWPSRRSSSAFGELFAYFLWCQDTTEPVHRAVLHALEGRQEGCLLRFDRQPTRFDRFGRRPRWFDRFDRRPLAV